MKSNIVAGLLALCFGGLGIHWFYLGNSSKGTAYLVTYLIGLALAIVIIGFIPLAIIGILALIDAIQLLTMQPTTFNALYNKDINVEGNEVK